MEINGKEIRQAENAEVTVGTVSEFYIQVRSCKRDCVIDGVETKINTAWISGNLNVDVDGTIIKHSFGYFDTIRHKKNGEENKSFKGLMTSFGYDVEFDDKEKKLVYTKNDSEGLIPKIDSKIDWLDENKNVVNSVEVKGKGNNASRVKVTAKLGYNTRLNSDQTDIVFYNDLPVSYITTTKVSDKDSASFTIEGVVKEVFPELNLQGSATGRYNVDMIVPSFFGVDVFTFVMLDKWTNIIDDEEVEITKEMFYIPEDDSSFCKAGDTLRISGDLMGHTFGSVKSTQTAKGSFGGGAQNVKTGGTRVEWTIKAGDLLDGDDKYDVEDMAAALKERDLNMDNEFKRLKVEFDKRSAEGTNKKSSPKESKGTDKPFGEPKTSVAKAFGGTSTSKKSPFAPRS